MPPPRNVRIAGWILLVTSGYGLLSLFQAVAADQPHSSVLVGVASSAIGLAIGWALIRDRRWAYVPSVLAVLASIGWAAWFFLVTLADDYSVTVRVPFGLVVVAIASVPLVLLLTTEAREWGAGPRP